MRLLAPARLALVLSLLAISSLGFADEGPLDKSEPKGITPEQIIQKFAAKEKEFKEAREQYTYRQDVKVQVLDGDTVKGQYHEIFDVVFDDIRNRLPFVLTSDELGEYNVLYVGQQQEDELHCYVFDVAPKQIVGKK